MTSDESSDRAGSPRGGERAARSAAPPLSRLVSTTLILGCALLIGHACLRLFFDPWIYDSDVGRAAIRMSRTAVPASLHAFGTAAAATLFCALAFSAARGARVSGAFLMVFVLLAFALALLGAPWAEPRLVPEALGLTSALLGAVGVAAVLLAVWTRHRVRSTEPGQVAIPVIFSAGVIYAVAHVPQWRPAYMPRFEVVRQLLSDPGAWDVRNSHPAVPPRVGVICPSLDPALEGADMPALVLSPPSEVAIRITDEDGPCVLRTAAGVSHLVEDFLLETDDLLSVEFEVSVNGVTHFEERIEVRRGSQPAGSEWSPVGGEEGIFLRPDDEILLRTALHRADGSEWITQKPVPAGFQGMLLERRVPLPREVSSPERPNIVFVLQDTLRRDRLSVYGYPKATSPNAERLAATGTVFEESYATSSWTWPSTASMFTGRLPQDHGVIDDGSPFLDHDLDTLAETLQRAGFTTAAFSGNPLISPGKNFGQGFESFVSNTRGFRKSDELLPGALDWMRSNTGTRFFLYLHLVDAHEPLQPLPEALLELGGEAPEDFRDSHFNQYTRELLHKRGHTPDGEPEPERVVSPEHARWISDLYDAGVWTGDHYLGQVLDTVEELGLTDETIFVFTSDHGEELLDHGLYAHGQSVHGELVRVPLLVSGPGIPAGARIPTPVSNRHLAPTLAEAGGARSIGPADALNLFAFEQVEQRPVFFSTAHGWWNGWNRTPVHGVRVGDWSLHFAPEAGPFGEFLAPKGLEERLYHLESDPGETVDRAGERPFWSDRLRGAVQEYLGRLEREADRPELAAGGATKALLNAIGYTEGK